jgi:hypothetical protein
VLVYLNTNAVYSFLAETTFLSKRTVLDPVSSELS